MPRTVYMLVISLLALGSIGSCQTGNDAGTTHRNATSTEADPYHSLLSSTLSPSGGFTVTLEQFNDGGTRSQRIIIHPTGEADNQTVLDLTLRLRDSNFVSWADTSDILWVYSGDVGTFFWVYENGAWVKNDYKDGMRKEVPLALKEARPKYFGYIE